MTERLKTRRQFLRVAGAKRKWAAPGIVLQAAPQPPADRGETGGQRYGLTVSKRVGNAVTRNRARRRLRAVAEEILPRTASAGYDYVLMLDVIEHLLTPEEFVDQLRKAAQMSPNVRHTTLCPIQRRFRLAAAGCRGS